MEKRGHFRIPLTNNIIAVLEVLFFVFVFSVELGYRETAQRVYPEQKRVRN